MNTDKAEALARQNGTFQAEKSEGVTSGVRDGDSQGQDGRLVADVDAAADQKPDGDGVEPEFEEEEEEDGVDDDDLGIK